MPLYRCLILGENVPMKQNGALRLKGFYTTRWVEAPTVEAAELAGADAVRADHELSAEVIDVELYFEEIVEVPPDTPRMPNSGATWFDMENE